MNLRDLLESGPAKAIEISESLSVTSNGAVKSRGKLFNELKAEVGAYGDLVEKHLFPALKQHEQTKSLVPNALKASKEFRSKLADLDALSQDDKVFIPRLKELMRSFEQFVRHEQKDLVPAVLRAVSEEQAAREQAAVQKAADESARKAAALKAAERTRKAAEKKAAELAAKKAAEKEIAEQSRKAAERKAVREARKAAEQKAAEQAQKAAERKAAERARKAAERKSAQKAAQQAAEGQAARAAQRVVAQKAAKAQERAVEQTVAGPRSRDKGSIHALAALSMAATRGMTEMGSAWMEWLGGSGSIHALLSRQLLDCRTMQDLARTQQSFLAGSAQGWMEHNQRVLQISRHAAEEGMRALNGRRPGPTG